MAEPSVGWLLIAAAGAIHVSVRVGGVFSSVYAFRRIRDLGASAAPATWSMAVTGLLATATLTAVALLNVPHGGGRCRRIEGFRR